MKLLIAGSRDFKDYKLLSIYCKEYDISEIVSGTARGADLFGERYAKEHNIPIKRFPADWNKYGKRAGYLRNVDMGEYCDCALIFWDEKSRGAKHMIDIMDKSNKPYRVVYYNNVEWVA